MQDLNCNQVITLLTFYIEEKLNPKLMESVEYHLNICSSCRKKYMKLRKILNNFAEIKNKITQDDDIYDNSQYKVFKENLSAYVDNELSDEENIRIKKIAIANPLARKDLEQVYAFKQLLQSSFIKTKNNMTQDFSQKTLNKILPEDSATVNNHFGKILAASISIIICIIAGILNFTH